jgi:alcohol dehydrogenase (cytochrome c)
MKITGGFVRADIILLVAYVVAALVTWPAAAAVSLPDVADPKAQNKPAVAEAFQSRCASCHANIGPIIQSKWADASLKDLANFVRNTMPPGAVEPLDEATASNLASYMLELGKASVVASAEFEDDISRVARARLRATADRLTPVTDGMLRSPPIGDWLVWRGDVSATGFSRLTQIDRSNVKRLRLVWSKTLGQGTNGIAPLAHDGVIFVYGGGRISAIEATSGDTIWSRSAPTARRNITQPRGVALYGNALFASTVDNHVMGVDMRTGRLLWDRHLTSPGKFTFTAPPLVASGRVFQSAAMCASKGSRCFMTALDATTGAELWRTYTVPGEGERGAESWGGAAVDMRSGAGAWSGASYDFARGQVLFGTGNSYAVSTMLGKDPKNRSGALYSNSTLKLDAKSGKIVWYNQHFAGDVWDEDWAYERTIIKDPRGSNRPVVVSIGKLGILDALDLETGRYLWSIDMGFQDLVKHIDPRTGAKTIDADKLPVTGQSADVCPFAGGVRNWPATSYDPDRSLLFVSTLDACMKFTIHGASQSHLSQSQQSSWTVKFRPGSDRQLGGLMALDMRTGKVAWAVRHRADTASAMLATKGGLVFTGTRDRWFRARDVDTGNTLWQVRLTDTPNSFPITFMADGKQYVAVVTGGGTYLDGFVSHLTPEIELSTGKIALWVFALDAEL